MLVQRQLTVLFSVLLVLGCSQDGRKLPPSEDGGQGGTGGVADSGASYASLEIVILGLPEHLPCPVLLNVSEEKEYLLYGSTDFPLIRPGTYQIRAPAFIPDHNTYYVTDFRGTNVHLEANQRERIEIRYERLPYLVHFEPLVVPWRGEAELRVRIEREPDFSGAFELSIEAIDPAFSATPSTVSLPASESEAQFLIRNTGPLWSVETPFGLTLMVDDGDRAFGFRTNFGSIILVTSDADDGPGSLRDILEHADEVPHPRRVFFAENVRHIRLHSPLIFDSSRPLELRGHESFAGRGDFPPGVWLDAGDAGRALEVRGSLRIRDIGFQRGQARRGGCILNEGELIASGVSWLDCKAEVGGAIESTEDSILAIDRSTFLLNSAEDGGAIHGSELHLENSTVAHNRASETGGGLFLYDGLFDLRFTTLVMNEAPMGGGLYGTEAYLSLGGTIVARNTPHDLHLDHGENGELFSEGFNLLGIVLPEHRAMLSSSDLHGSSEWPLDPHLVEDLVSDHPSFSPRRGSPAVDAVPSFFCEKLLSESLIDQWGGRRPRGRACDAGSVEMY